MLSINATCVYAEAVMDFTPQDELLLDDMTQGCAAFFWKKAHPVSGLAPDASNRNVCSVASVGFQLAALPISVQRGYVPRDAAGKRAVSILTALWNSDAHYHGMFAHFVDMQTGKVTDKGYENVASSIDTALVAAGMIVAGEYFNGQVKQLAHKIYDRIDWRAFLDPCSGQVYMAWQPDQWDQMNGPGTFQKQTWDWYTDELLLIVLLGQAAPNPQYRLPADTMTQWKRPRGNYKDGPAFIYTWPGTLFTYTFAHCFYDFKKMGKDRQGIDWYENTRHACMANRDWCRDHAQTFKTYGPNRWGITAGAGPADKFFTTGDPSYARYIVPGHQPRGMDGNSPELGTLQPYGAAMALPFIPQDALAALHEMRHLRVNGQPVWASVEQGGYGFWDGFNLDVNWVCDHVIGIAQGPMMLSIENARTGLIWNLMMRNDAVQDGCRRAGFTVDNEKERITP